ncbi:PAS domain S-box protein [Daejeonella lutea]|uniref:histidine kinase n=1 Tax=Daejeonella lutea TaxID=572036 RepID=A0A1T5E6Q0_9SPHI|nr:PAS domain S-box protein [Daejeonella lutea]SKB79581.1 PAS domain S-box-containing protein [Daejeonella lutea]
MLDSVAGDLESFRLQSLESYRIIDSLPEEEYDRITRLASYIFKKPIAVIAFVDHSGVFIKSQHGIQIENYLRNESICRFTIEENQLVVIPDASLDPRTANLSGVLADPKIKFYAGAPLRSPDGQALGSLALMDVVPGDLNNEEKQALTDLADEVVAHLEARKKNLELQDLISKHEEISTMFNNSAELQSIMDRNGTILVVNKAVEKMLGYTPEEGEGKAIWDYFPEEDLQRLVPIFTEGLSAGKKNFEVEARIKLKDGTAKWMGWSLAVKNNKWYANGRDISEQKKMIAELEQLSLVANKVNNGVVISDSRSRVIWSNEASENITGYSLKDLQGHRLGDILSGEKTDKEVLGSAREKTKNKLPFNVDLLAYRKDGTPIWLSILNSVVLDSYGNIDKEVEVIIDITSRKKVEEDLETLSLVASKSASGVVIRDGQGKVIWINSATEAMLGYNLEELQGKRLSEVVVGNVTDTATLEEARQAIAENKSYRIDLQIYRKDGTPIWIHASTTPILNDAGEIERQVEIITDITERKNTEEQLTLLSLVASKTINGVAISTSDGKIKWVNDALEKLTGYTLEDFKNTRPGDLLAGEGTDKNLLEAARKNAMASIPSTIEILNYKKDGTPIWLSISNTPTFTKDGTPDQQVEIINDISERKLAEQELIKTREEALQLSKAKETFLSVMSHEIRTPLNAVIGMSHILMDDNPTESQMENLKILGFSAQNLLKLINDILDFTKIETGNMVLENVNVNLKELVSQTLNSLQFKTAEKAVVLKSEIDHRIPTYVKGDNTRLYQILINLLGNSVKFTEVGEVKLKLDLVQETKKTVRVRFEISDTGIGIEPDKIDLIFESYTQASSDTTRKYGGTGLGLAITRSLLLLHNSSIEVESERGKGSKFSFIIDFNRSQESIMLEENKSPVEQLQATILVVDDNEINRILASKVLSKWGVKVDFAENGKVALDKVVDSQYDLVLMDLHMPVMDGMDAARAIRKLGGAYTKLPIVALTASLFAHELETISECGMDGYVMKPFVPGELYAKISTLLKRRG